MKIYTKTGDAGETGLYGGTRVPKDAMRIEACGTVDELNACLGFVRSQIQDEGINTILHRIQNELFDIGADLATLEAHLKAASLRIPPTLTPKLEKEIDQFEDQLPTVEELHFARWFNGWRSDSPRPNCCPSCRAVRCHSRQRGSGKSRGAYLP